jgi:hypothetical protein
MLVTGGAVDDHGFVRWLLALVGSVGCYAPDPQPGAPCPAGVCPEGLECSPATSTCEVRAVDAAIPDDASDAMLLDAPPGQLIRQQITNHAENVTTLSATLPAAPAADHLLVMIGANLSGALTSVSGGGAIWSRAASSLIYSNVEVWYGTTNGSSATVTIAMSQAASAMWMSVSEWSGLEPLGPLDGARADHDEMNPVTAGSITLLHGHDLLLFAATTALPNSFTSPTPGTWTALQGITSATHMQNAWYRIVMTAGAQAPQVLQSRDEGWEAAVVAFRITQ